MLHTPGAEQSTSHPQLLALSLSLPTLVCPFIFLWVTYLGLVVWAAAKLGKCCPSLGSEKLEGHCG